MKKTVVYQGLLVLLLLAFSVPANAVLREENIDKTIIMLKGDLDGFYKYMGDYMRQHQIKRAEYNERMLQTKKETQELSLVLFTQNDYYIFGLAQATKHIDKKYKEFCSESYPFDEWRNNFENELNRYKCLSLSLKQIDDKSLSPEGKKDKLACVVLCQKIEKRMGKESELLVQDAKRYKAISKYILSLKKYNEKKFNQVRDQIFINGSENYFNTLAHLKDRVDESVAHIKDEYTTGQMASHQWHMKELELLLVLIALGLLSWGISFCIVHKVVPERIRKDEEYQGRSKRLIVGVGCLVMALLMVLVMEFMVTRYYFEMLLAILLEFLFITGFAFLAITLRMPANLQKNGWNLFLPQVIMALFLLSYRLAMVSIHEVSLTLPLVFVIITILQFIANIRYAEKAWKADRLLGWTSLVLVFGALIFSWIGYRFLSMEIMTFWFALLASNQILVFIYDIFKLGKLHHKNNHSVCEVWFVALMRCLVMPILTLFMLISSLLWAADVFCMKYWAIEMLKYDFINFPNVITVSVARILFIVALAFIFYTIIYVVKEALKALIGQRLDIGSIKVFVTVGSILMWCIYACVIVFILNINNNGIIAAVGGASMGIGFALKDTINNLFCGLSLMMGRVRVGDTIECDGIQGKIKDVGIRSTVVETTDGCVIAFLNNQLFMKNFKNLTKNHEYMLGTIQLGIRYGEDFDKASQIIKELLKDSDKIDKNKGVSVQLSSFSDNYVDITVSVWPRVSDLSNTLSQYRAMIYKAFNENGIKRPFPQRDLHVINIPNTILGKK